MTSKSASELVAERVKEIRQQRGWSAEQLAARCAELGAPEITRSVIANIETGRRDKDGRRRRDVTVEELLVLAYALDAYPPDLLSKDGRETIAVTADTEVPATGVIQWIRGFWPSPEGGLLVRGLGVCGTCGYPVRAHRTQDDGLALYTCSNQHCPNPVARRQDLVNQHVLGIVKGMLRDALGRPVEDDIDTVAVGALHRMMRSVLSRVVLLPVPQPETKLNPESLRLEWTWETTPETEAS